MLPEKFLDRMKQMLGEEYPLFLQSYDREECHALRKNPLKFSDETLQEKELWKQRLGIELSEVPWNIDGFYYSKEDRPGRHPYHEAGVYYIQEASAMSPVVYLDAQPGEKVLDLCAAPGGKTTQIGVAMQNQGVLVCNEIHPARAKILSENVERMGIQNAIVTNETPQKLEQAFPEYFDRILVDAPCSGEGMFRKNEDAQEEWSPENVQLCADRQDEILECAQAMLKPGGILVYSTCTFAPLENEGSISRFIHKYPEFEILPVEKFPEMESGVEKWVKNPCEGLEHTIRLWPHKLRGEGHYVAVLRKRCEGETKFAYGKSQNFKSDCLADYYVEENGLENRVDGNLNDNYEEEDSLKDRHNKKKNHKKSDKKKQPSQKGKKEKEFPEYIEFCEKNIKVLPEGTLLTFGEQLYLAPREVPSLDKLKVLRPGLHLGTCKKNRFEPSHALALALSPEHIANKWELSSESSEIAAYLKGQTFVAEGEKGWYLITVDGYGIGWGKLAGNVMKNHYPKGLRK